MPRPWRVPRLQVPQPIKVPSAGLRRRLAYDLVAYAGTQSGIRVEFAFLFGRRPAYLVHLAAQLQIFWPVGDRAHELTTRIRPSLRHQSFKLQLTCADPLSRLCKLSAAIKLVSVRLNQKAPGRIVGRRATGNRRGCKDTNQLGADRHRPAAIARFWHCSGVEIGNPMWPRMPSILVGVPNSCNFLDISIGCCMPDGAGKKHSCCRSCENTGTGK